MSQVETSNTGPRYAVDEHPSHMTSALLGLQSVALIVSGIAITPIIVLKAADDMRLVSWVVFAALFISGLVTILQARPIGRFGAGFSLFMGTSGAFIAVSIGAVKAGGLPLLGTLVITCALFQFLLATRLGTLRKIVTPAVGGSVVMLIAVAVMPIAFHMLDRVPKHFSGDAHLPTLVSVVTFLVIVSVCLFGRGRLRLWGPLIGLIIGWVSAYFVGLVDLSRVESAAWFGLPKAAWPGLDMRFSHDYWLLLPGFLICSLVGVLETFGDGLVIQQISRRGKQPVDFKVVQGAVNADGVSNLLSGLACTLPNTTYSTSLSVVQLTGVASRRVAVYGGAILMALALCPKFSAVLESVPSVVAGPFLIVLMVLLFANGVRLVVSEGLGYEEGILMGLAFWLGIGFQDKLVFADQLPPWAARLFDNGMTTGGLVALVVAIVLVLKQPRMKKLKAAASQEGLKTLMEQFNQDPIVSALPADVRERLGIAVEEAFNFLRQNESAASKPIELRYRSHLGKFELEFVSAPGETNVEELLEVSQLTSTGAGSDTGLRALKAVTDELRHQQFHGADYLSIALQLPAADQRVAV